MLVDGKRPVMVLGHLFVSIVVGRHVSKSIDGEGGQVSSVVGWREDIVVASLGGSKHLIRPDRVTVHQCRGVF